MIKTFVKYANAYNGRDKKNKGFTLIELIVVLAVLSIVLTVGYLMLVYNQTSFMRINNRVNAQNEFRFIMNYLQNEIGTASEIKLLNERDVDLSAPVASGYRLIFIQTTDGKGNLVKREGSATSGAIKSSDIPGLSIELSCNSTKDIVKVKLKAAGGHVLEKEILTQNGTIEGDEYPTVYNYILVKPVI